MVEISLGKIDLAEFAYRNRLGLVFTAVSDSLRRAGGNTVKVTGVVALE
jgi:hypothetical protein